MRVRDIARNKNKHLHAVSCSNPLPASPPTPHFAIMGVDQLWQANQGTDPTIFHMDLVSLEQQEMAPCTNSTLEQIVSLSVLQFLRPSQGSPSFQGLRSPSSTKHMLAPRACPRNMPLLEIRTVLTMFQALIS